jgi:peptidylprolyl isomerase
MPRLRALAPLPAVLALIALAGCGGGSNDKGFRTDGSALDGDPSTTIPATLASIAAPKAEPIKPLTPVTGITGISTDVSKKPAVPKGTGTAPTTLQGTDVVTGTGTEAKSGDKVSVEYVGKLFSNGKQFDTSWGRSPFEFTLGQGGVIKGWDQGVPGMKVGGRRVLVIPADLAYGATGSGSTIPPNSTLTFVIDLKKVTPG